VNGIITINLKFDVYYSKILNPNFTAMNRYSIYLICSCCAILFTLPIFAQEKSDIPHDDNGLNTNIGGGVVFGLDIGIIGINLRSEFPISPRIEIAPGFVYYLQKGGSGISELNLNIHYQFDGNFLRPYALGGAHVSLWSGVLGEESGKNKSCVGMNLGGGVIAPVGNITLFAETRFLIAGCNDFSLTLGAMVPIK
jgi:opacity protein-like surface antigen